MVCSLHESGWVSYQCDHLSPFSLRDNNSVWTGMRSMSSDGCGVIFPFSFPPECPIRPSVCLFVSPFIYLAYIIAKSTEGIHRNWPNSSTFMPSTNIMLWLFFNDSVFQGYTTFVQFYDAHEAQTAEWSTLTDRQRETPWQKKQRHKSGQKKKEKRKWHRGKNLLHALKDFYILGNFDRILAFHFL